MFTLILTVFSSVIIIIIGNTKLLFIVHNVMSWCSLFPLYLIYDPSLLFKGHCMISTYCTCLLTQYVTPPHPSTAHVFRHTTSPIPLLCMSFLTLLNLFLSLTSTAAANGSTRVACAS